jgi:hypothetical protein
MDNEERFEMDREERGVREDWADSHGYWHGTCRTHGGFWTDTGDGCPQCEPDPPELEAIEAAEEFDPDDTQEDCDLIEQAVKDVLFEDLLENCERIQKAARDKQAGNKSLMAYLRQNGVFKP